MQKHLKLSWVELIICGVGELRKFVSEPEEPDHDHQPVGGAVLVWSQAGLGAGGVRRSGHAARAFNTHLVTWHSALQQVRSTIKQSQCLQFYCLFHQWLFFTLRKHRGYFKKCHHHCYTLLLWKTSCLIYNIINIYFFYSDQFWGDNNLVGLIASCRFIQNKSFSGYYQLATFWYWVYNKLILWL